ncbi:MAG: hypothetical protein ABL900_14915 [Burkholderiaceae bacterium]
MFLNRRAALVTAGKVCESSVRNADVRPRSLRCDDAIVDDQVDRRPADADRAYKNMAALVESYLDA